MVKCRLPEDRDKNVEQHDANDEDVNSKQNVDEPRAPRSALVARNGKAAVAASDATCGYSDNYHHYHYRI